LTKKKKNNLTYLQHTYIAYCVNGSKNNILTNSFLMNAVMNLHVPQNEENFFSG